MQFTKRIFFATISFIFLFFVGCSTETNQEEITKLKEENAQAYTALEEKLDELNKENEKLRADLEVATENLQLANTKIKDLESVDSTTSNTVSENIDIVPPQVSAAKSLIGEWFYPEFRENSLVDNWIQSLVFRSDGTGTITRTFYLPKDLTDYSTSDLSGDVSQSFSWSLNGDTLHTEFDGSSHYVDYTFLAPEQQLRIINEGGEVRDGTKMYLREMPSIPDNYIEKNILIGNMQAQEASLSRKFLGNWYFDVLVWTFNDDGSGIIDIPELGDQPASTREFSYSLSGNNTNMLITFDWDNGQTSYYYPTFNPDGSMSLTAAGETESITLTRKFDVNNCPISQEIISNGIGVLSGSIFSDILPQ